jgi:chaperonin GroEL
MKLMRSGPEARKALLAGAAKMAAAVGSTLGPSGHNVAVHNVPGLIPGITRDGVSVAREIVLPDPFEDCAAQVLKDASQRTVQEAGDGTTTSCLLAEALFRLGTELIDSGKIRLHEFQRTCQQAADMACAEVDKLAIPLRGDLVERVASLAANNDPDVGKIVAEAMRAAGQTGVVTIQDSQDWRTTVDVVEGMSLSSGYMSPYFAYGTDGTQRFDNPSVLVAGCKLSRLTDNLKAVIEAVLKNGKPLVIICPEADGPFLATMVLSVTQGGCACTVVRVPGTPEEKNGILADFSLVTCARTAGADLGLDEGDIKSRDLGRCARAVITKDRCTLTGFPVTPDTVNQRVAHLLKQAQDEQDIVKRESLERRIARLTTGIVTIKVGASSDSELRQKKARIEDSLLATRCALEDGIVAGGGMTYLSVASAGLVKLGSDYANLFGHVLSVPFEALKRNAGGNVPPWDGTPGETNGYDFVRGEWGDLIEFGVIDPAKVVKAAIRNSFSAAATLAAVDHVITLEQKK